MGERAPAHRAVDGAREQPALRVVTDCPEFTYASYGCVQIIVWKRVLNADAWMLAEPHFQKALAGPRTNVALYIVMREGAQIDGRAHSLLVNFLSQARTSLIASAHILPSTEIWAAVTRIALNTIVTVAGGLMGPARFFHDFPAGADWLEARLRADGLLTAEERLWSVIEAAVNL